MMRTVRVRESQSTFFCDSWSLSRALTLPRMSSPGSGILREEVGRNLGGFVAEANVEAVAEAVRSVGAHHQRAIAEARATYSGCSGDGRLADATLSGIEDDSHVLFRNPGEDAPKWRPACA